MNHEKHTPPTWSQAKSEAIAALVRVAKLGGTIFYSDLVTEIRAIPLHPQSKQLDDLLSEISEEEFRAHRGMLSAVVVRTDEGDPGEGFFRLAKQLGIPGSDPTKVWVEQLSIVHETWKTARATG